MLTMARLLLDCIPESSLRTGWKPPEQRSKLMANNLYRVRTRLPADLVRVAFVDWFEAASEAEAKLQSEEEAKRYGLPAGCIFEIAQVNPETLKPIDPTKA